MSDDQGSAHFGFMKDSYQKHQLSEYLLQRAYYGKEPYNVEKSILAASQCTPNIDKLRQEGMLFTNYLTGPSCAPTRAAMLTAKYPQRFGVYVNFDAEKTGIADEQPVPLLLQQAGYKTATIGKWHAGPLSHRHPLDCGFDYFFGFEGAWTTYHNSQKLHRGREKTQAQGYLTEQITTESIAFIDKCVNENKPFFLNIAHPAPHSPTDTTAEKYYTRFDTGSLVMDKLFGAIYAMDESVGEVIERLKFHSIDRDTIIFFTIDNGSPYWFPLPGNGIHRGFKMTAYDGAHRVPMIARWHGKIKPNSQTRALACVMDLIPTAIDAAAVALPDDIDGQSLLNVMKGRKDIHSNRALFWAGGHTAMTEEEWVFLDMRAKQEKKPKQWFAPPSWAVWKGKWKLVNAATGRPRLYDVENDPREIIDLSIRYPAVVRELSSLYSQWIKDKTPPSVWDDAKWRQLKIMHD